MTTLCEAAGDVLLNPQAPTLLQMAFAFLETLVLENGDMQAMLLEHNDLFLSYMDVAGLSVETLFAAMVRNNLDHIQRHGKEWCGRVLQNVVRDRHFDTAQLSLISALAECNGQAVKLALFMPPGNEDVSVMPMADDSCALELELIFRRDSH